MYLKRIVLNGFKSFADRTELDFGPGITGIVGPNGCGKSNVLDALRWVLGSQSPKALRGHKMLDVVFSGSGTRKPANFAEVQLTFDNSDHRLPCDEQDVTIARLLYRSGDSEYRLNGKACRLKDIRDLFLDTGIGVEAYSVIEQGEVDLLLQSSPVERRQIFEEAAGISRYKVRRTEAQRRLERTQQNLLRLEDVIGELEKRLRSVKLAAGKARNFQEYDGRLRELRSTFSLAEYHELSTNARVLRQRVQSFEDIIAAQRVELGRRDADAAEREASLQRLDERIRTAETELARLQSEAATLAERIAQTDRRIEELTETHDRQEALARDGQERAARLQEEVARQNDALAALAAEEQAALAEVAAVEQRLSAVLEAARGLRETLDAEKRAAFDAARAAATLSNEQRSLERDDERLRQRATGLAERFSTLTEERARLDARHAADTEALAGVDAEVGQHAANERALAERLKEHEAARSELATRLSDGRAQRSALVSRLQLLEDMERRQEGVAQGARWLLEWRASHPDAGVIGLVADLLQIDDPRVTRLQSVLAQFENHVVVRAARPFLAALREFGNPPGPIQVLALDRLASPSLGEPLSADDVRVLDWVRCAPDHQALAQRLLADVVLVPDADVALDRLSGPMSPRICVTEAGEAFTADGAIRLGEGEVVTGLISRKAEIRRLRLELDEVETTLERGEREKHALDQAISDTRLERDGVLQAIAGLERRRSDLRTELVRVQDQQQRAAREADGLQAEQGDVARQLATVEARTAEVLAERSAADADQQQREARVEALAGEMQQADAGVQTVTGELTAARVAATRIAERRTAAERALAGLRSQLAALENEQAQARQQAELAVARTREAEAQRAAAVERQDALAEQVSAAEIEGHGLRSERQDLRRTMEAGSAVVRRLTQDIENVEGSLHAAAMGLRESEVRIEGLLARVHDELGLDLTALYPEYEPTQQDWTAVKAEIEELKQKIHRLGHVNLDSIAELEELTPRFENLVSQRDDLRDSVTKLEALIAELDDESRVRFVETFQQIRTHFQELFRKLFGGGKADIILEDENDPLECGIEILARPRGKETQSISLLSGGEKTMTAVALLMSVFKSRPSPFAILDEVDAALDEANVGRFNDVIREFLTHSQFIVITHSKRTMQSADVLYGITMQEPGVSKRMAVRFDDRVQTPSVA